MTGLKGVTGDIKRAVTHKLPVSDVLLSALVNHAEIATLGATLRATFAVYFSAVTVFPALDQLWLCQ